MNRTKLTLTLSLLLLLLAGCSQGGNSGNQPATGAGNQGAANEQATTKTPPADVVKASADPVEIKAGGSAEATVKVTVASGYHMNANPASASYLIPTALQLQTNSDITADAPTYPAGVTKKFNFSPDPLSVYEGEVSIKVKLSAAGKTAKGEQKVGARVRVQPCNDDSCFPPRTIETAIPVTIK